MRPGTKVIKNIDKWVPNEYDDLGRGQDIGYTVEKPHFIGEKVVTILWPNGQRHLEQVSHLMKVKKDTVIRLSKKQQRRLEFLMVRNYYRAKEDIVELDGVSGWLQISIAGLREIHQLFDLIRTPESERQKIWSAHRSKIESYSEVYKLKPQKEGRDNKDVRVGSGYGGRGRIRYPRKGHKNAWKKFYKLFPCLAPDYKSSTLYVLPPSMTAQKILDKPLKK